MSGIVKRFGLSVVHYVLTICIVYIVCFQCLLSINNSVSTEFMKFGAASFQCMAAFGMKVEKTACLCDGISSFYLLKRSPMVGKIL